VKPIADTPRKLVHIVTDEKFIDMAFREFEAVAPGVNKLVMLGKPQTLRHVKTKAVDFFTTQQATQLIRSDECAAVVYHSLDDGLLRLINNLPINKQVIWLGWGYDYYDRLLSRAYPEGLYLPKTKALWAEVSKPGTISKLASTCKSIVKVILGRTTQNHQTLMRRINYFSPVIDTEYQLACQLNPWFRPQYLTWNYGTVEDDFGSAESFGESLGDNILVGNSAAAENNHLEVFDQLERYVDLSGRKIIVPLSYGDDRYKKTIISYGKSRFGKQFVPLTDFIGRDAYVELLQSCGHVFMNHLRQQALGNICIMMLKGARIYMNRQSPLYLWLLSKGARINSIGFLADSKKMVLEPLPESERRININVVNGHWGRVAQRAKTRRLIEVAMGRI